mmetsp:Transcript_89578/g.255855  ORF Transcript_89578/g.255855 Transcript_89578/m.255855 type:complete len:284 (-) Transcript_89578:479-1330(-)
MSKTSAIGCGVILRLWQRAAGSVAWAEQRSERGSFTSVWARAKQTGPLMRPSTWPSTSSISGTRAASTRRSSIRFLSSSAMSRECESAARGVEASRKHRGKAKGGQSVGVRAAVGRAPETVPPPSTHRKARRCPLTSAGSPRSPASNSRARGRARCSRPCRLSTGRPPPRAAAGPAPRPPESTRRSARTALARGRRRPSWPRRSRPAAQRPPACRGPARPGATPGRRRRGSRRAFYFEGGRGAGSCRWAGRSWRRTPPASSRPRGRPPGARRTGLASEWPRRP